MISFGQFVFESTKPKVLCDFLCFVFDLDFEATAANSFAIDFFGLKVLIIPCEKTSTKKSGCVLHAASIEELDQLRQKIDDFDEEIIQLLKKRMRISKEVGKLKE